MKIEAPQLKRGILLRDKHGVIYRLNGKLNGQIWQARIMRQRADGTLYASRETYVWLPVDYIADMEWMNPPKKNT